MREDMSAVEASRAQRETIHVPGLNGKDRTPSGFTAVNGDSQRNASFRSDDYHKHSMPQYREPIMTMVSQIPVSTEQQHSWRPTETTGSVRRAESKQPEGPENGKRKRSEIISQDDGRSDQPYNGGAQSPKRRMTAPSTEVDSTSSDKASNGSDPHASTHRPATTPHSNTHTHERSPPPAWHPREPPPRVRPETEAQLAESLQSHLHGAGHLPPAAGSASPVNDNSVLEEQHQSYSPEQLQSGENGNQPKKKRNFGNRTKTGCHTCRGRKKKCDEAKPVCGNCQRGGFQCAGYGPKPPGYKAPGVSTRQPVPLQSKQQYEPPGPTGHYNPDGRSYSHWGRIPQQEPEPYHRYGDPGAENPRHSKSRENWPRSTWHGHDPAFHLSNELPPVDFAHTHIPSLSAIAREAPPPPPDLYAMHPATMPPYNRPLTGPGATIGSRESITSSQRAAQFALSLTNGGRMSEKEKMLLGKPYLHFLDSVLATERQSCKAAVERYNKAAMASEAVSDEERARCFGAIVDPSKRPTFHRDGTFNTRPGRIGHRSLVEMPFNCDYGYNLSVGDDVVIQTGCYIQDPCEISIGDRTIIGPNVKLYGLTASVDPATRKGSQGTVVGGSIIIGSDCFIGGDVIILPYRTIGRGSVVGAGSVVTKNVPPNTVVAGNPAREVRSLSDGPVSDKRVRPEIQRQNEDMISKMRAKRGYTDV